LPGTKETLKEAGLGHRNSLPHLHGHSCVPPYPLLPGSALWGDKFWRWKRKNGLKRQKQKSCLNASLRF